jgi:hypothetical protein
MRGGPQRQKAAAGGLGSGGGGKQELHAWVHAWGRMAVAAPHPHFCMHAWTWQGDSEVSFQPPSKQQKKQLEVQGETKPHWTQAQAAAPGEAIKVTLHDCLACSGCVTTAETVLLETQSGQELMSKLRQAREAAAAAAAGQASAQGPVVVVSVSAQSIAALAGVQEGARSGWRGREQHCCVPSPPLPPELCSPNTLALSTFPFAAFYSLGPSETFARLSSWLRLQGVAAVLDVRDGRDLALLETAAEFIER